MLHLLADATASADAAAIGAGLTVVGKGIMLGFGMIGPAIGIGLIGASFMNAVGRNPEASKFLGQVLVFVAMAELMGLLVFASLFIVK